MHSLQWSLTIGRLGGIAIRVHISFLIFLLIAATILFFTQGLVGTLGVLAFLGVLFGCVLLHELGHAWAAARCGIRTPDITLLPIGGVARLARLPHGPGQELFIALAGPAVNLLIAGGLILILGRWPRLQDFFVTNDPWTAYIAQFAWINAALVVFNLIPAFPMDGGRVLRAGLAFRISYGRATAIAARVGQCLAILMGLAGLFINPILIFTAIFVFIGARQEAAFAKVYPDAYRHGPDIEIIQPNAWRHRRHQLHTTEPPLPPPQSSSTVEPVRLPR